MIRYASGEWTERAKRLIKVVEEGDLYLLIMFYEINGSNQNSIQVLQRRWRDADEDSRRLITKFLGRVPLMQVPGGYLQEEIFSRIEGWVMNDGLELLVDRIKALGHFKVDYDLYSGTVMNQIKEIRGMDGELSKGVVGVLIEYLATAARRNVVTDKLAVYYDFVKEMVKEFHTSTSFMRGAAGFVKAVGKETCTLPRLQEIYSIVEGNLSSFDSGLRLETLNFLNSFSQEEYLFKTDGYFRGDCNVSFHLTF